MRVDKRVEMIGMGIDRGYCMSAASFLRGTVAPVRDVGKGYREEPTAPPMLMTFTTGGGALNEFWYRMRASRDDLPSAPATGSAFVPALGFSVIRARAWRTASPKRAS